MDELTYAMYPVFRTTDAMRRLGPDEVEDAAQEVENLHKAWSDRISLRGTYSTVGFRPDADLMLWWVGHSADDLQDLLVEFRRTALGRKLEMTWSFMGVVKPAEFSPDHAPAFVKGTPPGKYACVYPYVRTIDWYLLPPEERGEMLREHGVMGREYPDVLANTTSAFGLSDWEWILAFEADALDRIVECLRRLRDAQARRYTKEEVPFVTGIRKDLRLAIADLV
ncbi:MAG: chlorite dismutase family protein [Actinomycetota bacterium]|nr:chlorite dismutase family protein [Actinomycetota bacterium]